MINQDLLDAMREWIIAEIHYGICDAVEDDSGYHGFAHKEGKIADKLYTEFCAMILGRQP